MSILPADDVNRHLVTLLQANAREPLASLARKVGLSRNAVTERLRRLERDGVIDGYTVRLGTAASPSKLTAYMLLYLNGPICERVLPGVYSLPEVKQSLSVSGDIDMIVYVEADSVGELNRVRDDLERIHGVRKVTTAVVLAERFDRR